jgi:dimethylamine/trimethylamine dehydrogenase
MAEAVHEHGALAGIELAYNGLDANNLYTRAVSHWRQPRWARWAGRATTRCRLAAWTREDIRELRRWHRAAALRAKRAGFDLIYVYAGHALTAAAQFLLRRYNDRTDEYGGSLENRTRLFRELLEDTKEAVGDKCGIVARFAVEELLGKAGITHQGEGHDIIAMLAELPDLWDVNLSGWSNDSATSRFEKEGYQEKYTAFVKSLTGKPVVGVGRYTSPDTMVSAIRRGVLDMIGAARPSIADPFLPVKIKEDRLDEIRECIGCNICVTGDTRFCAHPLHAEPHDGRGMAARLAPRDHRAQKDRGRDHGRWRWPGWPGVRRLAWVSGATTSPCWTHVASLAGA